jgi:hypothetical protein
VKYPDGVGPPGGTRVDGLVALVDVGPTIKQVLGADWETSDWRGQSLLEPRHGRSVYADNAKPAFRALYRGTDKLIQELGPEKQVAGEKYFELEDFKERGGGAIPDDARITRIEVMRELLSEIDTSSGPATEVTVSPEVRAELEALGYVE